jgi:ATP-dependent helicase HrpB
MDVKLTPLSDTSQKQLMYKPHSGTQLPISPLLPEIYQTLLEQDNLVLKADPGAGKSTALPMSLLNAPWLAGKKIIMLEPRRVAAKSIANYLSQQLGEQVGQRIGYQIKNEKSITQESILHIVTPGILIRRLQSDPELDDVAMIIFDEFHERSINSDLALLLSLEIQQTIRDDLKLLVMSATIDTQMISAYMGEATIIECPGRAFPVQISYTQTNKKPLPIQVLNALNIALNTQYLGDILVFLPGQAEIRKCISAANESLAAKHNVVLLSLYGGLSITEQEQVLNKHPQQNRRIIFATNIAETSLTIEGITTVIDSGYEKKLAYDPTSGMTRLTTTGISKASAQQRTGRAGRTQAGQCIRLWDEQKHTTLKDFQTEEILSADLSDLLLELALWGECEFTAINWLTAPLKAHFDSAKNNLVSLAMLNSDYKLTSLGKRSAKIGLQPRLCAMLLQAQSLKEQLIACELAALLSDRDIFLHCKGIDIIDRLLAVQDYKQDAKKALQSHPLKHYSVKQLLINANNFRRILTIKTPAPQFSLKDLQQSVPELLLLAYPDRLAKKRSSDNGRYQLANSKGVFIFEDEPLYGSDWLVVADCDAQTTQGRIFSACVITQESVYKCLNDKIITQDRFQFDNGLNKITGKKLTSYGSLVIKSTTLSQIPIKAFQSCLNQVFKSKGLALLNWTSKCEAFVARAHWLSQHVDDFPNISKPILLQTLDNWLFPYLSNINTIEALKNINVYDLLLANLTWQEQQFLDSQAPINYITPSNKSIALTYDSQQGPMVRVQLQEMFGQIETPLIGDGKIAIRFELLSPARRAIQTTSDLGTFWKTSYFEVAKEMRGKYPKHRWPEQPLLEKAGRSIKRKPN